MKSDFPGLGTHWWIEIWDEIEAKRAGEVFDFARRFASEFEARYSRFKPDSEISRLNRDRRLALPDGSDTRRLLTTGIDFYRRTGGVFNILTGHILEARGYDVAYSFTEQPGGLRPPGNPTVDIKLNDVEVLLHGNANIDIGGYGKGYLIDLLAEEFKTQFGIEQFLINGGGDIFVTHQAGQPVEIYLQDPQSKQIVGSTKIMNRGFASSSPHLRRWPRRLDADRDASGAPDHHHIVSPANQPIKDVIYLTAPTAAGADAFATTLLQVDEVTAHSFAKANNLTLL